MYCFTYVNGLTCVLNELMLWSEISNEHPVFIKTVAQLTGKGLSQSTVNKLDAVSEMFAEVMRKTAGLRQEISQYPYNYPSYHYYSMTRELVDEFLLHDRHFFEVLPEVRGYGMNDASWQQLLEHITKEQTFMYELFTDIRRQMA